MTYTRCRIDTINSPDDERMSARNMWRFGINIYEKRNVRQVAHLQELYRYAGQQNRKLYRKYFALSCALKYLFDCPSMHCRGLQLELIYSHAPILELVSPARFRRAVMW
jgi:hypothetical protein